MSGAIVMALVIALMLGITFYLIGSLARSIQNEKKATMRLWKNFGLSLGFCALFLVSWVGQGAAATAAVHRRAIDAGRSLASDKGVKLIIHTPEGIPRNSS